MENKCHLMVRAACAALAILSCAAQASATTSQAAHGAAVAPPCRAVQETIDIAKGSGGPAEIYHLKVAGRANWGKLDQVIGMVEKARADGTRITADMYTYTAGATGLVLPGDFSGLTLLARAILAGDRPAGSTLTVDLEGDELVCR